MGAAGRSIRPRLKMRLSFVTLVSAGILLLLTVSTTESVNPASIIMPEKEFSDVAIVPYPHRSSNPSVHAPMGQLEARDSVVAARKVWQEQDREAVPESGAQRPHLWHKYVGWNPEQQQDKKPSDIRTSIGNFLRQLQAGFKAKPQLQAVEEVQKKASSGSASSGGSGQGKSKKPPKEKVKNLKYFLKKVKKKEKAKKESASKAKVTGAKKSASKAKIQGATKESASKTKVSPAKKATASKVKPTAKMSGVAPTVKAKANGAEAHEAAAKKAVAAAEAVKKQLAKAS